MTQEQHSFCSSSSELVATSREEIISWSVSIPAANSSGQLQLVPIPGRGFHKEHEGEHYPLIVNGGDKTESVLNAVNRR